jgi:hypothetical protein
MSDFKAIVIDGKSHRITPDYAMTGWHKAFKIAHYRHSKTRPNLPGAQICKNYGRPTCTAGLGFAYRKVCHISTLSL